MTTEVKKLTPHERKEKTAKLKEKHDPVFKALGIKNPRFIPKMAHYQSGLNGLHMGFFESELINQETGEMYDIYTEKVDKILDSEDPDRVLYKHTANPFYKEEYATSEPNKNGHVRYFIPLDEMEVVEMPVATKKVPVKKPSISTKPVTKKEEEAFESTEGDEIKHDELTARDYACIHLKYPGSSKSWLNSLIVASNEKPF